MYKDNLIEILKKLKINYNNEYLIKISSYDNRVICPYLPYFSVSVDEYYYDIFLEMVLLNLIIYTKSIDYNNNIILFDNNDSYKLILYTKNPCVYDVKLVNMNENLSYYENSVFPSDTLIMKELFKIISFLKFLGSYNKINKKENIDYSIKNQLKIN